MFSCRRRGDDVSLGGPQPPSEHSITSVPCIVPGTRAGFTDSPGRPYGPPDRETGTQPLKIADVAANLAEGHGRSGRDRLHFWRIAEASAKEVDSHLRLLQKAGVINGTNAERALQAFDEVRAMRWRPLKRPSSLEYLPAVHSDVVAVDCLCRCLLPLSLTLPPNQVAAAQAAARQRESYLSVRIPADDGSRTKSNTFL